MDYNEKQVQIIETAEKLFANNGFEGTSIRDIAQEAGINIAMISYYFGSKEKLMEAIFAYRIKTTFLKMENIINNDSYTPFQKVEKFIEHYIDKMFGNQCFYRLMMREPYIQEFQNISDLVYEAKKNNLELAKKVIHEGQKRGEFRKNVDVGMMIMTMIGTANHFVTTQEFYKRYNNMLEMPQAEFEKHMKKKLHHHLKTLFKSILTNEEK
jgi:AcrR family transcriptional regulator